MFLSCVKVIHKGVLVNYDYNTGIGCEYAKVTKKDTQNA